MRAREMVICACKKPLGVSLIWSPVSIAVKKHHNQMQVGGERIYFTSQVTICQGKSRQELKTES